jgi:hypothetical protein
VTALVLQDTEAMSHHTNELGMGKEDESNQRFARTKTTLTTVGKKRDYVIIDIFFADCFLY